MTYMVYVDTDLTKNPTAATKEAAMALAEKTVLPMMKRGYKKEWREEKSPNPVLWVWNNKGKVLRTVVLLQRDAEAKPVRRRAVKKASA